MEKGNLHCYVKITRVVLLKWSFFVVPSKVHENPIIDDTYDRLIGELGNQTKHVA